MLNRDVHKLLQYQLQYESKVSLLLLIVSVQRHIRKVKFSITKSTAHRNIEFSCVHSGSYLQENEYICISVT
jgi:hypothetical protein